MGLHTVTQCLAPDYRGSTNGPYDLEVPARELTPEAMVFAVYDLADCTSGADAYLYFEIRISPQILGLEHLFAPIEIGMHPRRDGEHSAPQEGSEKHCLLYPGDIAERWGNEE
jgi:hypothetical protein